MQNPAAVKTLEEFRLAAYGTLGRRKDSLFELMEAVLAGSGPATIVRLSLAGVFRRAWPPRASGQASTRCAGGWRGGRGGLSSAGADDGDRARGGWAPGLGARRHGLAPAGGGDEPGADVWASHHAGHPAGWGGRRLGVRVVGGRAGARDGLDAALGYRASRPAAAPRPVCALDSGDDPVQLTRAELPLNLLVRLRSNRVFSRAPGPYQGRGAPRKYGDVFRLADPVTHGAADASVALADPQCGRVQIDAWRDLRAKGAADAPVTIVRVQLERLPRRAKPPAPLWLAWIGGELPEDLGDLWRDYILRFTVEHGFRFLKQALGWTTVRPRNPAAADRWTWLLALALWQLWLARPLVADQRLPWERPLPASQLTPGRVRRAFAGLFAQLGTPARPPKPRGKAPGRRPGHAPGSRSRHPVARRRPKRAA